MIVVWRVTESCNLSCPFCAYDRRVRRPRRHAAPEAVARFGAVLADYQRATGDRVLVSWLGGEPLLWPPLQALSTHFAHDLGLRLSTTTNGTTLGDGAVREHVLSCYRELTVSVDGVGTSHEELRGWPGGYAALRDAVQAVAAARPQAGALRLRANVVLLRDTIADFAALCRELADWGVDEITFNQVGGRDRPEYWLTQRLLPAQVEAFVRALPALRAELAARGVLLAGSDAYLSRLLATSHDEDLAVVDCAPGERFLFLDVDGRVAPCSFTTADLGVPLATIASVDALQRLPARFRRARALGVPACADCHSTQVFGKFAGTRSPVSR